jgi:hypothetical protein
MFFTARCARGAEFTEEKYIFFSAERAEKKRSTVIRVKLMAVHTRKYF